jgi:hypothetical protein
MRFESYKPFISLIFKFFVLGSGKVQITKTTDTESADMGARLCNENAEQMNVYIVFQSQYTHKRQN